MSEISHLVVHPQEGLDDTGLLLLERLFLALRDHLNIGIGIIRGVLLDSLQLLLRVQLPEGASKYPQGLGGLFLLLVEVKLCNRLLCFAADPLYLALELIIGINVLGHGVFGDLDHRLNGLDILAVAQLVMSLLQELEHVVHVFLVLI